jgi:hypothetical protein
LDENNVGAECGDYYFAHQPAASNSNKQDPLCLGTLRESQPWPSNFHAAPVFQWAAWSDWIAQSPGTRDWFKAGVEFRNRMAAMGCQSSDRWLVNELPTSWRATLDGNGNAVPSLTRQKVRARIASATKGLFYGGNNPNVRGFTADVVITHNQGSVSRYQENLQTAYPQTVFWRAMDFYLEGWGDETYAQCQRVCVSNLTARSIADQGVINYLFHQRFLAIAAPAALSQVKTTMANRHLPILNAVWKSVLPVYDSQISVRQMARMIRQQIYSTRRAAEFEQGSAGRIAFAWTESAIVGDGAPLLARNLARALHDAYVGDSPGAACVDNDGAGTAYYGCPPAPRTGATINAEWDKLKQWRSFE